VSDETYPEDLLYHKEHEWVRADGGEAVFGITWFAQDALGEIVYVALPSAGDEVTAGAAYGELESVKAVSEAFAPLSGEVVEVNARLEDVPQLVNEDCYDEGWLIRVRMSEPDELERLLDVGAYRRLLDQA
jgi:glycine cleavage system H protein